VSESEGQICVAYRDDGFWAQCWYACCLLSRGGRLKIFPAPGFVGLASTSFRAADVKLFSLRSIRMRRLQRSHVTAHVPLWRLTCEWETPPPQSPPSRYGLRSVLRGSVSAADGEVGSHPPIQTTSTSTRSSPDKAH